VGKGLKEKSRSVFSNGKEEGEGKESKEEGKF
jgi:hypothetical protein